MKVLSFGSLNYDYVYSVPHIARPGETIDSNKLDIFCGGKGLNQSIALRRAGVAEVFHAGFVGPDGEELIQMCVDNGIDPRYILSVLERTGNAIIQVCKSGENCIVLFGGANRCNSEAYVDAVLSEFEAGDALLVQNEINCVCYLIEKAYEKGMRVCFNPSPLDRSALECDFSKVEFLLVNEIEAGQITGEKDPERMLAVLKSNYPETKVALTLGGKGVVYQDKEGACRHGVYDVPVVDTTAAGDTFTGHFLGAIFSGKDAGEALRLASVAASIAVSREGAANSIPTLEEVTTAALKLME